MQDILDVLIRTLIGFSILLLLIRFIGKKQMGQLTIFTYITGIALGNIAGDMVVHHDIKIIEGIVGMSLWAILTFLVEYLSIKSNFFRVALDGQPTIVIKKGEVLQHELRKHRINMDDLTMLLRTNNVFSIAEVDYAILEPNGQLSVRKKSENENVTRQDMNLPPQQNGYLPMELIVDGKVVQSNLKEVGLSERWLYNQLEKAGILSSKEVFYAELQSDGSLFISKKRC